MITKDEIKEKYWEMHQCNKNNGGENAMIVINKAILHVLDFNSGVTVFSDQELTVENSIKTFLLKHIEKSYQDQALKIGKFYEDSQFQGWMRQYISENLSFVDFSRSIAETVYNAVAKADKLDSADLLIADIEIDERRLIAFFKTNNKIGFIHQVTQQAGGVKNEIINHYAILPGISQKMNEYAFVDPVSNEIFFVDRKYEIEGEDLRVLPECVLECSYTASPKATITEMFSIVKKVAENHGQNSVQAMAAIKSSIAENVQCLDYLLPIELGKEIFEDSPEMQREYASEIEEAGLANKVKIERDFALKKTKVHKIKTDTGIEISIPVDYFQNPKYVEFVNNSDGTLSINLKGVMSVMNK